MTVLFSSLLTVLTFVRASDAAFTSGPVTYSIGHGLTFQISLAYSEIVRSLENFPEPATFKIALRAQASVSSYKAQSCWSASR